MDHLTFRIGLTCDAPYQFFGDKKKQLAAVVEQVDAEIHTPLPANS